MLYSIGYADMFAAVASNGTMSEADEVLTKHFEDMLYQEETGLPAWAAQYAAADGSTAGGFDPPFAPAR
jgi:hypothetical protein